MKNFIIIFIALFLASCGSGNIENISQKNENISEKTIAQNEVKRDLEAEILALEKEYNEIKAKDENADMKEIEVKYNELLKYKHSQIFSDEKSRERVQKNEKISLWDGFFTMLHHNEVCLYHENRVASIDCVNVSEMKAMKNGIDFEFLKASWEEEYILKNAYSVPEKDKNGFYYSHRWSDLLAVEWLPAFPITLIIDGDDEYFSLVAERSWVNGVIRFENGYILQYMMVSIDPDVEIILRDGRSFQFYAQFKEFYKFFEKNKNNPKYEVEWRIFREITAFKEVEWGFMMTYQVKFNENVTEKFEEFIPYKDIFMSYPEIIETSKKSE